MIYKNGDPHPVINSLAFLEYDGIGREVWTSLRDTAVLSGFASSARLWRERQGVPLYTAAECTESDPPCAKTS